MNMPPDTTDEDLDIATKYVSLRHAAEEHPEEFKSILGKEPSEAMERYDEELEQKGIVIYYA